jgi:hypothetical protein
MRVIEGNALAALQEQYAVEPINIIGIEFEAGTILLYADKDIRDAEGNVVVSGKILRLDSLEEAIKVSSGANSVSVSVELDDTNGEIKAAFDQYDLHKKPCYIYQYFDNDTLTLDDKFLIVKGEMSTPITWDEGKRTVTFDILSKIESEEVGFAPEEGQFPEISSDLLGRNWPLCFGDCVYVPAVKSVDTLVAQTREPFGIPDATLPWKRDLLWKRIVLHRDSYKYYHKLIRRLKSAKPLEVNEDILGQEIDNNPTRPAENIKIDYADTVCFEDLIKQQSEWQNRELKRVLDYLNAYSEVTGTSEEMDSETHSTYYNAFSIVLNIGDLYLIDLQTSYQVAYEFPFAPLNTLDLRNSLYQLEWNFHEALDALVALIGEMPESVSQEFMTYFMEDLALLRDLCQQITMMLTTLKTLLGDKKDIFKAELEDSQYRFKTISRLREKCFKIIDMFQKDYHMWIRAIDEIANQQKLFKTSVSVVNGSKFPQNEDCQIEIDGLIFEGQFNGDTFTFKLDSNGNPLIFPKYTNINVDSETTNTTSFELTDASVQLSGHYCVTPQNLILKVNEQSGKKCYVELVERPSHRRYTRDAYRDEAYNDLLDFTWNILRNEGAQEHTEAERQKIIESAVDDLVSGSRIEELRKSINDSVKWMKDNAQDASIDDMATAKDALFENLQQYQSLMGGLSIPFSVVDKTGQLISDSEFKTLLGAENLQYQEYLRSQDASLPSSVPFGLDYYSVTGDTAANGIIYASPILLPSWLGLLPETADVIRTLTSMSISGNDYLTIDQIQKIEKWPPSTFWVAQAGAEMRLASNSTVKFVCNTLPSTIKGVYAYRGVDGIRKLSPVPSSYYTKNEADSESYDGLTVTTITLHQPLSAYESEGWEDGIYVSLSSSVGPNTADIISHIATNYTDLTVDATSFSDTHTKVANYPMNFAITDKMDAVALIEQLAWQGRCVAYVREDKVYLKYLSDSDTPVATITASDVLEKSVSVSLTPTEDLVTKFVAKWQPDYLSRDDQVKSTFRHNIARYGTQEQEYDFFAYNIEDLVAKSATFWMIRKSNTWKRIRFKTTMKFLNLEVWDTITLNLPGYVATGSVTAIIESAQYNSEDSTIEFECWTPVRVGESEAYTYAFPSGLESETTWPTEEDIATGDAGNPNGSFVSLGNVSVGGSVPILDNIPKDWGRALPDVDDVLPISPLFGIEELDYALTVIREHKLDPPKDITERVDPVKYKTPPATGDSEKRLTDVDQKTFSGSVKSKGEENGGWVVCQVIRADGQEVTAHASAKAAKNVRPHQPVDVYYDKPTNRHVIGSGTAEGGSAIKHFVLTLDGETDDYLLCMELEEYQYSIKGPGIRHENEHYNYGYQHGWFDGYDSNEEYSQYGGHRYPNPYMCDGEVIESEQNNYNNYMQGYDHGYEAAFGTKPAFGGVVIPVAKPHGFQKTPWHETPQHYNGSPIIYKYYSVGARMAYNQYQYYEWQRITPSYSPGDIIMAVKSNLNGMQMEDGTPIEWTDLNTQGRIWAAQA